MKLETTYENNNYPIIVENHAIKYLDTYIKDYDKVFLIDDNVYHQFSEKINSLISNNITNNLSYLLVNNLNICTISTNN